MTFFYAQNLVDAPALSKHLTEIIEKAGSLHWAVLVDTAFDHDARQLTMDQGINCFSAVEDTELEEIVGIAPYLYPMDSRGDVLGRDLLKIINHCNARPMWSLVASRLNPTELARRWASMWRADVGDGQDMLLRFADSRVLPTLPGILDQQWPSIAGSVEHWYYPNRTGQLAQLASVIATATAQPRVKLNNDHLDALIRAAEADGHLVNLASYIESDKDKTNPAALHTRVEAACALADQFGVNNQADRQTLALLATLTLEPISEYPGLNSLLASKAWLHGQLAAKIILNVP